MNLLDENIPESQRRILVQKRIHVRQIGLEVGRCGMKDVEIIPLLHSLARPTFFTFDAGFFRKNLCHPNYCLAWLDVRENDVAYFIRRLLRHSAFDTRAKRVGAVLHIAASHIIAWRLGSSKPIQYAWMRPEPPRPRRRAAQGSQERGRSRRSRPPRGDLAQGRTDAADWRD